MSAPIIACELADALGGLAKASSLLGDRIAASLGCTAGMNWMVASDGREMFVVYLHDCGQAFQGIGDTPSSALMSANSSRQSFIEKQEIAA